MKRFISKINFKLVGFWAAVIIVLDFVAGTWYSKTTGLYDRADIRTIDPMFNHCFKPNSHGIMAYGVLRPVCYINSLGFKDKTCREVALSEKKGGFFLSEIHLLKA